MRTALLLANMRQGWGSTVAGLLVVAYVGYQLYLNPQAFGLDDILEVLAALGLIAAPPLRKKETEKA